MIVPEELTYKYKCLSHFKLILRTLVLNNSIPYDKPLKSLNTFDIQTCIFTNTIMFKFVIALTYEKYLSILHT